MWLASNPPVVVVDETPQERELATLIQNLDPDEIAELARECLDALLKPCNLGLDLRPQQFFHAATGKLRLQLVNCSGWITEQAGECSSDASLRTRPFEHDAIEDLNLIQPVTLGLEEPPPLVDGRFYDRVIVVGEGDLRPILLEQILIDMEAGAKRLERCFQPLDGILLLRVVETFVVHARDAQHHPHVPAFGQKHTLIPESVKVDVIVKRGGLFPRLDDLVESQH